MAKYGSASSRLDDKRPLSIMAESAPASPSSNLGLYVVMSAAQCKAAHHLARKQQRIVKAAQTKMAKRHGRVKSKEEAVSMK